jgi:hypothetical protein
MIVFKGYRVDVDAIAFVENPGGSSVIESVWIDQKNEGKKLI